MKRSMRSMVSLVVSSAFILSIVSACSSGTTENTNPKTEAVNANKPAAKISIWTGLNVNAAVTVKNYNEILGIQEWQKRTNVNFEFTHPAVGTEAEQLNLLLASNNLPDAFMIVADQFPGGLTKAYNDGVIIKLNDLIDKYAPNLKKVMADNPEVAKQIKADNGDIYALPHLRTGKYKTFGGMMIRQDWLDELGLQAPETIDEWETVLRAFKEKKGAAVPLLIGAQPKLYVFGTTTPNFIEAFGTSYDYFLKNGSVKYGPMESEYKSFLTTFQKWYKEGLIDQEFATNDSKTFDAKVTSGKAGAFFGYVGSSISKYLPALQQTDPKAKLAAVQFPVLKKGDQPINTGRSWEWSKTGTVITKANKHPEETVKAMDYLFSPEGILLKNFGVEGVTYTLKDGQPVYTDLIMKNPDKLPIAQALSKYFMSSTPFVGVDDDRSLDQTYVLQPQKDAIKLYAKYADNSLKFMLPPTSFTSDEAKEMSKISADTTTYRDEMFVKFIMGAEPIANFDKYVDQLKKFKIDRGVQIQQDAYNRFKAR